MAIIEHGIEVTALGDGSFGLKVTGFWGLRSQSGSFQVALAGLGLRHVLDSCVLVVRWSTLALVTSGFGLCVYVTASIVPPAPGPSAFSVSSLRKG